MNAEMGTLGNVFTANSAVEDLIAPPPANSEATSNLVKTSTTLNPNAIILKAKPAGIVPLPAANENKVSLNVSFLVPKSELRARDLGENSFYNLDVAVNVARGSRKIEETPFRFDVSTKDAPEEIPITVYADLYPGSYRFITKIVDANNEKVQSRNEIEVTVPDPSELKQSSQPEKPNYPTTQDLRSAQNVDLAKYAQPKERPDQPAVKKGAKPVGLLFGDKQFFIGINRFEVLSDEEVASVEFQIDGVKFATKEKRPFSMDIDLGPVPRKHALLVIGRDKNGVEVGRDAVSLNQGAHSATLKIVKPAENKAEGSVGVQAAVTLVGQQKVSKMDFFVNDVLSGSRTSEPWLKTVHIPSGGELCTIRVVAKLDDGTIIDDLKYINYRDFIANVEVKPVELYAVVSDGHKVVEGLGPNSLNVFEDGVPQTIQTLEYAKDSPVNVGIAIDTSGSMDKSLLEVVRAALGFVDKTLKPRDRGFTMSFDDSPHMLAQVTDDKDKLKLSISNLRAQGLTAFYDAIIVGLYELQDMSGKKALVVLSDGKDEGIQVPGQPFRRKSVYDFDAVKNYAEHAGIAIYPIGFRVSDPAFKKEMESLAAVSGGRAYFVSSASELTDSYKEISLELHSQYVITYYSLSKSKDWRSVTVKTKNGYKVRVTPGYYP